MVYHEYTDEVHYTYESRVTEEGEDRVFDPTLHDAELTGQLGTWATSSTYMQAAMLDRRGETPASAAADEHAAGEDVSSDAGRPVLRAEGGVDPQGTNTPDLQWDSSL